MPRLSEEALTVLKDQYGVDIIWSFCRMQTYLNCQMEYQLKYLEKEDVATQNFYGWLGTISHEIKQDYLEGKISYSEMGTRFKSEVEQYKKGKVSASKCPSYWGITSEETSTKLFNALYHYFTTMAPPSYKTVETEVFAICKVGAEYVQVYIDELRITDEGKYIIIDTKTASITSYKGKSLQEQATQLYLYALALMQTRGICVEDIALKFDMMRYVNICYKQKNGRVGKIRGERQAWVLVLKARLEVTLVKELGYAKRDAKKLITRAVRANSLQCMPVEVQNQYHLEDYLIDLPVDASILKTYYDKISRQIVRMRQKCDIENKSQSGDTIYCNYLCSMRDVCPYRRDAKQSKPIDYKLKIEDGYIK